MQRRSIALAALALTSLPLPTALAQGKPPAKQRPTNRPPSRPAFFYGDHPAAMAFAGDLAVTALDSWQFDAAFLGGEAMNTDGIFNSHAEVVRLQRAAFARSRETFFCLDASKLSKSTPHRVATWPEVTRLITDATPPELTTSGISLKPKQLLAA